MKLEASGVAAQGCAGDPGRGQLPGGRVPTEPVLNPQSWCFLDTQIAQRVGEEPELSQLLAP